MSTMSMPLSCDQFAERLANYLEGELPENVRVAMEAHAAVCAGCGELLADLGTLREEAAALPALMPSRDLWTGIAERIDARVITLETPGAARISRRTWLRPAAAAAALVIAAAGISHVLTRISYDPSMAARRPASMTVARTDTQHAPAGVDGQYDASPTEQTEPTAATPVAISRGTSRPSDRRTVGPADRRTASPSDRRLVSAEKLMEEAEPVYDREIVKLRRIVKERRSQLDPKTIAVLEQSIAVIDSAIAQSRAALAKDPASGFLATQLNHSLEKKVELLRTAALLPART